MSSGEEGKTQRWRIEDGKEVCGEHCQQPRGVTRWNHGKWNDKWPSGGMGWGEPLESDRVQSTQQLSACGGRLPRRDENRDWIQRQDSLRLPVALDWPTTARPLAAR